jgi:hypothetical protein
MRLAAKWEAGKRAEHAGTPIINSAPYGHFEIIGEINELSGCAELWLIPLWVWKYRWAQV